MLTQTPGERRRRKGKEEKEKEKEKKKKRNTRSNDKRAPGLLNFINAITQKRTG